MSQQVIPLLMEWKDVLSGQGGLFLNLQNAGGMSFWGVFFFFLASPFHLLVLLVDKPDIYFLVNLLVLGKLSLASATASLFFRHEAPGLAPPALWGLSLSYGLCGYGLLYYQNLVWLDILYLFPLTMLGFVQLMEEGRFALLTASLTLSLTVNYYLSYMLFLCMVLSGAVFFWLCVPREHRGERAGKLGLSAVVSLLLTAVIWLPSLLQCLASARTGGILQLIRSGKFLAPLTTTLPVLLCTIGAAILPLLSRAFPRSLKSRAIAICWALTVLPMLIEPVNKLWHTGSYQAFPARYGYIPVLFGLWYFALGLNALPNDSPKRRQFWPITLVLPVSVGVYILCTKFQEISSYTSSLWVGDEGFLWLGIFWLACAVSALCAAYGGRRSPKATGWTMLALVLIQASVQLPVFIGSAANTPSNSISVASMPSPEDDGLYRVKQERKFCHVNLLGGMGLPTLNHYTSLTDRRFLSLMKKLGYSSYWMETSGCCGTRISDILLSNKYILSDELQWIPSGGGNLGYLIPSGTLPETLELGDRLALQNEIAQSLTGEEVFTRYGPLEGSVSTQNGKLSPEPGLFRWEISVEEGETLYFDAFDCISTNLREAINDGFSVKVNGEEIAESYPTQRCNGILQLGRFEHETVAVEVTASKETRLCSFGVWGLKDSAAERFARSLSQADLRFQSGTLSGSADAREGQSLFLSIPSYSGMTVRVNGQKVLPRQVLDCLMEIPLPEGYSEITVRYLPAGWLPGLIITIGTAALIPVSFFLRRRRFLSAARRLWYLAAPKLLILAAAGVLLIVYLLPPLVWLTKFL